jgi:DNA polymerase III sliding clamp (beta) subunit (PCNA family)
MQTLNKDLLIAAKFASKNPSRPVLTGVLVTNEKIVATDSFKLIEITHKSEDSADFPIVPGVKLVDQLESPVLLPAKDLLAKLKFPAKVPLPILEGGALCNDSENNVGIVTSDLETSTTLQFKKIKGDYPDYTRVMPEKPAVQTILMDAQVLMDALQAFKDDNTNLVELQFFTNLRPLMLVGKSKENENKKALVMPCKP